MIYSLSISYETVSDGRYHTVELLSQKKNFTLRVDQGNARSMINEGEHEYLRLSTPLFIGGLPNEAAEKAARQWQLRNTTSFRGCVKGTITISTSLQDSQHNVLQLAALNFR